MPLSTRYGAEMLISQASSLTLNHLEPRKRCLGSVHSQPLALHAGTSEAHCLFQPYCLYSRRFWNSTWARASGQASLEGRIQVTVLQSTPRFLTKNGSDQLHHLTLPSRLGPEGSSYSKEEETAKRNVLTADGLSSSCSPFTRVLSC